MGKDPTASGMKKPSAIAEGHFLLVPRMGFDPMISTLKGWRP